MPSCHAASLPVPLCPKFFHVIPSFFWQREIFPSRPVSFCYGTGNIPSHPLLSPHKKPWLKQQGLNRDFHVLRYHAIFTRDEDVHLLRSHTKFIWLIQLGSSRTSIWDIRPPETSVRLGYGRRPWYIYFEHPRPRASSIPDVISTWGCPRTWNVRLHVHTVRRYSTARAAYIAEIVCALSEQIALN